ncbi:MAG: hypothetical protein K0R61_746 [Microvirga sp.]|jgi:crossover junction endodeoxyribonuclease RuvC|nr:hypothetical protein [Microvirga sp.]
MGSVLGIDPGLSGALAIVDGSTGHLVDVLDMPHTRFGKAAIIDGFALLDWIGDRRIDQIVIEAPSSRPGQGIASSFQFGRAVGGVEAVMTTLGVPIRHIHPAVWKKKLGLTANKADSLSLARIRFGIRDEFRLKKHEGRAEAALLALFAVGGA